MATKKYVSDSKLQYFWGKVKGYVATAISGKQNVLTFDSTPIENSTNPVTSGGVYTAISNITSSGGSSTNPTLETEWIDVYSDWQAGYYYDDDNNYAYTQIPTTETIWEESTAYTCVSCTPYNNLIPVKAGEQWKYSNPPVHLDSKNAEVPSIIIFDSNKARIASYTRTYQDENTEFTIPANGVWMAVLYYNSQPYSLQKKVAKKLDKDAILNDVMSDYRSYLLTAPPTPRTLTKGYICLGTDDMRPWATKNLHTLFTSNNIPYYMAAIPENIKACVTNDSYKTNLDYMRLCVANGGEIISHSNPVITEANKTDFDTMYQYFCKNKEELEYYGFKVRGIFKAGGTNAIWDTPDINIDAWATHYYEFGDLFTSSYPYYIGGRTMLDDWADYSSLGNTIRNVCENHTFVIGTFHEYNANAETAISTILNALSNYTEGVDYEFVTPSQLYDILMPTTRPTGSGSGVDNNTTYSISMSNNVITLTGSDSTTSTITLPVYNGEVST